MLQHSLIVNTRISFTESLPSLDTHRQRGTIPSAFMPETIRVRFIPVSEVDAVSMPRYGKRDYSTRLRCTWAIQNKGVNS